MESIIKKILRSFGYSVYKFTLHVENILGSTDLGRLYVVPPLHKQTKTCPYYLLLFQIKICNIYIHEICPPNPISISYE